MKKNFSPLMLVIMITLTTCIIASSCFNQTSSKEQLLLERGKQFILDKVRSPSSTVFISSVSSEDTEKILTDWGVKLEDKHDVIMLEFETVNGFGGKVREMACIFFVNKNPIDYADASDVNQTYIHKYIETLKFLHGDLW